MDSHQQLVARAARGNRQALDVLFERHMPGLLAYVRLHAGPALRARESSLDFAQSACREVLADLTPSVELDEARFRHWLYTAAERKLVDRARYHGRAKRNVAGDVALGGEFDADELPMLTAGCSAVFTPSAQAQAREQFECFERAFRALPDDYREVIALSRLVGLTHAHIAQQLGRSETAVRTLLSRALASLALAMGREK